jgi:hypothetical protein
MGVLKDFLGILKIYYRNMYVIKSELDNIFKKCAKFLQLLSRRSHADPIQIFWIWPDQTVPAPTGYGIWIHYTEPAA